MEFEETEFVAAPSDGNGLEASATNGAPPAASGLDDFFSGSAQAPADAAPVAAAAADADPFTSQPSVGGGPAPEVPTAADEDAFFQHYEPPAHAAAPPPVPDVADPRIAWRQANNEVLKKKDAEEATAKQAVKETAAKFLAKYYEVRTTTLAQRKSNNRKSDAHLREVEVPTSGTAWEKISAMCTSQSALHSKDVSRFKAVLITAKAKNIAIKA